MYLQLGFFSVALLAAFLGSKRTMAVPIWAVLQKWHVRLLFEPPWHFGLGKRRENPGVIYLYSPL